MPETVTVPPEAIAEGVRYTRRYPWPDGEATEREFVTGLPGAVSPLIRAAERERIRQLAIEVDAEFSSLMPDGECDEVKFAALLGEDGT
jgi:hypothetical protein